MEIIGSRIREIRQARGIKQKDLAIALGLKSQNLSDYERGRAMPSVEMLKKLADFFEKPVDWFYGQDAIQKLVSKIEITKAPESKSEIMNQLELAIPNHETYPWGYFFRSQVILRMWDYALMRMNRRIHSVSDGGLHAFVIKEGDDTTYTDADIILPFQPDAHLNVNTLYIFPSPYKHPIIKEFFSDISEKLETQWRESEKEDFYFGYRQTKTSVYWVETVEILFRKRCYSPTYTTLGYDKARFIDFASIVHLRLPKEREIKSEKFREIYIFGGCHRLGTGTAAYTVSHPEFLHSLLSEKQISLEDSFELILKVETTTGEPLTTSSISLMDAIRIDNIEELTKNL
ncbi:helix-turn-helix transcriptional regulator [Candidatus Poribacteria bacterium]|nr:helix-turn-helix transcriptional regulator [Candidatus Poribacteria bacterium]